MMRLYEKKVEKVRCKLKNLSNSPVDMAGILGGLVILFVATQSANEGFILGLLTILVSVIGSTAIALLCLGNEQFQKMPIYYCWLLVFLCYLNAGGLLLSFIILLFTFSIAGVINFLNSQD